MKKIKKKKFGLLGKSLLHSFSKAYFSEKFKSIGPNLFSYKNFEIQTIEELEQVLRKNKKLKGLNITIPYKESIIPYLSNLSKTAKIIGAVNVVKISKSGKLKGYNTDWRGFKKALKPLIKKHHQKALILGTGGASKAVAYALKNMQIEYDFVSRTPNEFQLSYEELQQQSVFNDYQIIINTTPVGTFPNIENYPNLNYSFFTPKHIAFDLVYNPEMTQFLKQAKQHGAVVENGYKMLVFQAEKAWEIWNT